MSDAKKAMNPLKPLMVGFVALCVLVFGLGAAELLIGGFCLAVVLSMMGQYWIGALALGFALAFSSTAIVLPISGTKSSSLSHGTGSPSPYTSSVRMCSVAKLP